MSGIELENQRHEGWNELQENLLTEAASLHEQGRLDEAENLYNRILDETPDHAACLYSLACLRVDNNRHAEAAELLDRTIQADPGLLDAALMLGEIRFARQETAAAETAFRLAIAANPNCVEGWNGLGLALHALNRTDEALKAYRNALDLDPNFPDAIHGMGVCLQTLGRLEEAEVAFRRAVDLQPEHADARFGLGIALHGQSKNKEAEERFQEALRLCASDPEELLEYANTLEMLGRVGDAIEYLQQAAALSPDNEDIEKALKELQLKGVRQENREAQLRAAADTSPEDAASHVRLGAHLISNGNVEDGLARFQKALLLKPGDLEFRRDLAVALLSLGQPEQAIIVMEQVLSRDNANPRDFVTLASAQNEAGLTEAALTTYRCAATLDNDCVEAFVSLGQALVIAGKPTEAIPVLKRALALDPDNAATYYDIGSAYMLETRFDEAAKWLRKAIERKPDYAQAYVSLSASVLKNNHYEEGEAAIREAVRLVPDNPDYITMLGTAFFTQGRLDEAKERHLQALAAKPDHHGALMNLSITELALGNFAAAVLLSRRVVAMCPQGASIDESIAHVNLGMALLLVGRWEEGWHEYEWRKKRGDATGRPRWNGEPMPGKTLLVSCEQGVGDSIQFARYLPLVRERSQARIIFVCHKELLCLQPGVGSCDLIVDEKPLQYDAFIELVSLPLVLRTTVATIPTNPTSMVVDPAVIESWRLRVAELTHRHNLTMGKAAGALEPLKVGIVWGGNPDFSSEKMRSPGLAAFGAVAGLPNVQFYSIQKGAAASQLADPPPGMDIIDLGAEFNDFADTAGALLNMDLFISSCTSVPHLAGTLGVPTWLALPISPDWRWLADREDTPWYASMRLFRQPKAGDWTSVFAKIRSELERLTDGAAPE